MNCMNDFSENPFTALNSEDAFESLNNAKQSRGISDKNKHYLDSILHRVTEAHKKNVEVNLDAPKSVVIDIEDETDVGHEETDRFDDFYAADLAAMNDVLVDDDEGVDRDFTGFEFDQTGVDEDLSDVDSDYINDDQDIEEMVGMSAEDLPVGVARIVSAWSKASRIEREVAKRRMGLVDRATMSRETDRLVLLALGDAKQQDELSSPEDTRVTDLEAELSRTRGLLADSKQKIEELRQQIDVEIEQTAARADVSAGVQQMGTVPGVVKTYYADEADDEVESEVEPEVESEPDATPVTTTGVSAGLSMFGDDDDDDDDEDVISDGSEDTGATEDAEEVADGTGDEDQEPTVDETVDDEELALDEIPDDIPEFEDPEPEVDFPDDDDIPDDIPDPNER